MSSQIGVNKISELTTSSGVEIVDKLLLSNSSDSSGVIELYENSSNGTNKVSLSIPESVDADYSLTLPGDVGLVGQTLLNGGTGNLSWGDISDTNTIYVALGGSDSTGNGSLNKPYRTIKVGIAAVTGETQTNPFTIMVYPGLYAEANPITLKSHTNLISVGNMQTLVYATDPDANIFIGGDDTGIIGFALVGATNGSAIYMNVEGTFTFQNITIDSCLYGFTCNNALSTVVGTTVIASGTIDRFINCLAGSFNTALIFVDNSVTVAKLISAIGQYSSVIVTSLFAISTNIVDAISADDGAHIYVLNSLIAASNNAIHIGSTGTSTQVDLYGVKISSSESYDLLVESSSGTINAQCVDISLDKLSIVSGAYINTAGMDNEAFLETTYRNMVNFAVGRHDHGNTCSFGDGGSYIINMVLKSYSDSAYTSFGHGDDLFINTPATNSAIYIGTLHTAPYYGISYEMIEFIDTTGGSIVWEYYDGGTSSWLSFNIMETVNQSSTSNKGIAFTGVSGIIYTIRYDSDIVTGVKESSTSATGWAKTTIDSVNAYWIRIRVVTTIARSFVINSIRLKGNYSSIRRNGTRSYHGEARSKILIPAITSDASGTAGIGTISISSNISVSIREGTLAATTTDAVYFKSVLTEDMDTSSGIRITVQYSTTALPSDNTTAIIDVYTSIVSKDGRYDGGNSEQYKQYSIVFRATDTRYKVRNLIHDIRMDISNYVPGDMLFVMVRRLGDNGSDTFTGIVNITNINLEYKKWQDGSYLLPPAFFFEDDFSSGSLVNWSVVNNVTNKWIIGPHGDIGTYYSIYVSDDNTYPTYGSTTATVSHIYQQSTYPSTMTGMKITFDWRGYSELTYDYGTVWLIPSTTTPVVDVYPTADSTHFKVGLTEYSGSANTQSEIIYCNSTVVNAIKGNAYRLVFVYKSDTSIGTQPSFVITNIKINIF